MIYPLPEETDLSKISIEYLRKMILQIGELTDFLHVGGHESEDKLELANLYILNFRKAHTRSGKRRKPGLISDDEVAFLRCLLSQRNKVWEKKRMKKKEEVIVTQKDYIEDRLERIEEIIKAIFEKVESLEIMFSELVSAEDEDEEEGVENG